MPLYRLVGLSEQLPIHGFCSGAILTEYRSCILISPFYGGRFVQATSPWVER